LGIKPDGQLLLDVGAHDGYLLSRCSALLKVGLDLEPAAARKLYAPMLCGDGKSPPFLPGTFDWVLAMDVLEHEAEDVALLSSLVKLLKPGGRLCLSVPSKDFTVFPPFITSLLHKSWGHVRPGYLPEELASKLSSGVDVTFLTWNEPLFRLFYLPARVLWAISPIAGRWFLWVIAGLDAMFTQGISGHVFAIVTKK
ncbi:MAG: Methyltransferase type 11, partial [Dehalococcoidia bacterium]|nr:Methyltransferase type 11 [Dehalococcoidia bacterium]